MGFLVDLTDLFPDLSGGTISCPGSFCAVNDASAVLVNLLVSHATVPAFEVRPAPWKHEQITLKFRRHKPNLKPVCQDPGLTSYCSDWTEHLHTGG